MLAVDLRDHGVFVEDVVDVLAAVVFVELPEDNFPATIALKQVFGEPGVPVSILIVPDSNEPIVFPGVFFADQLKE
ncbi:MAG: hypothetical protein P8Y51_05965, partial [Campylobacterales bacterium]